MSWKNEMGKLIKAIQDLTEKVKILCDLIAKLSKQVVYWDDEDEDA